MEIIPYEAELAPEVARLYNRAVSGLPHCHPVATERLARFLAREPEEASNDIPSDEVVFVAMADGQGIGFVDTTVGHPGGWGDGTQGVVRFLCYVPGRRAAGQALLEAAEAHLARKDLDRIQAFPQEHCYPFYHLHAAYLSDRLGHVEGLLGMGGYERVRGEVILDWPGFRPAVPPPPEASARTDVTFPEAGGELPGVEVRAWLDGDDVGECVCRSCGEYAPDAEAQRWVEVVGLGVEDNLRGRGWGRYLLLRALGEARETGYRNAAISTWWGNHRALLFYSNYGFRVADWTYGWGREL